MNTEISPEKFVEILFRDQLGYKVEKIPESDCPRPDFYMEKNGAKYIVEVKSKEPSRELKKTRNEILSSGGIFQESYTLLRQKGITKTISDAKKQIIPYFPSEYFHLICFVGLGHNVEARLEQIESTLYGKAHVIDWSEENGKMKECFYFEFSDFYRYREFIDGVILINYNEESGKLCFNNYSPQYEEFLRSSMAETFNEGRVDPIGLEKQGKIWLVDSNVDRSAKRQVLEFLKKKYSLGRLTQDICIKHVSAQIIVEK